MTADPRVQLLLDEILESQRTPEEVCAAVPELLPEVRRRWARMQDVQAELDVMFPAPDDAGEPDVPASVPPPPGLPQIEGYQVESVLGRGGMGIVYRARQLRLNRPVALKMLLSGQYASPSELVRFKREAEVIAGLRHPNIVQVYDVGDHDGRPYFTMELVEGGTLAHKLAQTPQPAREAAALLITLARAVQAAHEGGVVHRDLKPQNVLLATDGTPRITDFGLARRLDGNASLTLSGARLGTPSYMAPEQALGNAGAIGPPADVYSLGAILYEVLTGRPPFLAETAAETERQVVSADPAPPSRLNARVPRDLETICLECLHKSPLRRYATAGLLAEDLGRFERGEPITARPTGVVGRTSKWVRRRPALAVAVAAGTLVVFALALAAWWLLAEQAALVRAVQDDLQQAAGSERRGSWHEARTALERARARLARGGPMELQRRVEQQWNDLDLVDRLERIRLSRVVVVEGRFNPRINRAAADQEYEAVWREVGLGEIAGDAATATARVAASDIRGALVAALDDWAVCAGGAAAEPRRQWILAVARGADPDPTGWRDRARDPTTWRDAGALTALAESAKVAELSVSLLLAIGERMLDARVDAVPFLERAQREHPGDFWATYRLGLVLGNRAPVKAVRYFQAAVALRPRVGVVRSHLGTLLGMTGQLDEALEQLQLAVRLDPDLATAHGNLGKALSDHGRLAEAIDALETAVRLDPRSASPHRMLGGCLVTAGRLDDAIEHLRQAVRLDPKSAFGHTYLGQALERKGLHDEAMEQLRQGVALDPECAVAHHNLASALWTRGQLTEALEHSVRAVQLEPENSRFHTGLAMSLVGEGRIAEAIAHQREAIRTDPKDSQAHFRHGLLLATLRRFEEARESFEQALRHNPTLAPAQGALGQALHELGRFAEALQATRRYVDLLPRGDPNRAIGERLLQRQELMLAAEARLPSILQGNDKPASSIDSSNFADLAATKGHHAAAAQLYDDALTALPRLTGEDRAGVQFLGACAATAAAAGEGDEAAQLSPEARTRWRDQAAQWLRSNLDFWTKALDRGDAAARSRVVSEMTVWQYAPDLAAVREPIALAALPDKERERWSTLWRDVAALLGRAQQTR